MEKTPKIIIAPCSFKGSLSSIEAAAHIEIGIKRFFSAKDVNIEKIPIADGGEGFVDCILASANGNKVYVNAVDPLGRGIQAFYGILADKTAIIELASASGLPLLTKNERNPLITTTKGTGQIILDALNRGCRKFVIGLGGSATNDCGHGIALALGAKFYDKEDKEITEVGGGILEKIEKIYIPSMDPRIQQSEFLAAVDVTNPLCGENGASYIFGPQKGASPEKVKVLDQNLNKFGKLLEEVFSKSAIEHPGSGAAGGSGACLLTFLNAKFKKGIDLIKEVTNFEERIQGANLIITGEGKLDTQLYGGKALSGILESARKQKIPVVAIAGKLEDEEEQFYEFGFKSVFSIATGPSTEEECMANAGKLVEKTARRIVSLFF